MADIQSNINLNIDTTEALASIRALQSQISAFHRSLAKGGAAANAQSAQMQQGLINTINKTGQFNASMTKVASTTDAFTNALEKNKLTMGETFKYSMGSTKTFGRFFRKEFDTVAKTARERVKDLQSQYIRLGRDAGGAMNAIKVRPLSLDMENLATKTAIAAQKQQILNQLLKTGSTNLLNWGKNTQWAGRQLMVGFTIPLALMGAASAKAFMDIEKQIIKIRRVYGDFTTTVAETDEAIEGLKNLATEFTKYGVAIKDTLELASDFAAAGFEGEKLTAQVRQASRLAVLGAVDQKEAFEATMSVTNAFGVAAQDLAGKIDFLNAVENQSVLSIEDLTIAIPKAAPVVRQLGGEVEDLAFFLTAMKEGGINASEGANALKSGLASLINPTKVSSEFLANLGINIKGIVEANKGDVKGTVVGFAEALDTLDPLNRARAIEQLFGKFQFSRISTLFQNVIDQGSQANRVLKLTQASSEELAILSERELSRVENSTTFKFEKSLQNFQAQLAPVGEQFLKAVTPLIEFATKMLEKFNSMGDGAKQFATIAVAVLGGIGPVLLMIIGLIANGAANMIKFVNLIRGRFQKTAGEIGAVGSQTEYMTQAQLRAQAAAASLGQVHSTLTQQFTSENAAIQNLIASYNQAILAQNRFAAAGAQASVARAMTITTNARGGRRVVSPQGAPPPVGYAKGVFSVPGPKGAGDVVPAMLSPGEAVIPAKQAKQYAPFIQDMISGNIPGFFRGVFLGMPKSSKAVSKNRETGQQIHELFKQSSFANTPATTYGHQIAPTTGHSFPIFGLGGVYQKGDKRVFVKPVMDEKAALAEMRATQIAREAHGLKSPKQKIVVIKDPMDITGQRKYLALESDLDPTFVNNSPLGIFNEKQYFKQLNASLLRADKDLSASNVYRNVVADVGPAGVFDRASGLRDYAKNLPSMEEQALVNLLGVKGGAKKAFAESTKGLMSKLTPEKYHQAMITEIQETLPKLKKTIASFNLKDPRDIGVYGDMVKRLEAGLKVDWRRFHTIHSSVTIPKPKIPKNVNVSGDIRGYKYGTGSVAPLTASENLSSLEKEILRNYNLTDEQKSNYLMGKGYVSRNKKVVGESIQGLKRLGLERQAIEMAAQLAKAKVSLGERMSIMSDALTEAKKSPNDFKIYRDATESALKKNLKGAKLKNEIRGNSNYKQRPLPASEFAHIGSGAKKVPVSSVLEMIKQGKFKNLDKTEIGKLKEMFSKNPNATIDMKSGLGFTLLNDQQKRERINSQLDRGKSGVPIQDFRKAFDKNGADKWAQAVQFGGSNPSDPKIQRQMQMFDDEFKRVLASQKVDAVVDTEKRVLELARKKPPVSAVSIEKMYSATMANISRNIPELSQVFSNSHRTVTEFRDAKQEYFKADPRTRRPLNTGSIAQINQAAQEEVGPRRSSAKMFGSGKPGSIAQLAKLFAKFRGFPMSSKIGGYASGVVSVPGPKGAGDVVPAMLSPGEAVIPAKQSRKYSPLISAMIAGNIPGYQDGKPEPKSGMGGKLAGGASLAGMGAMMYGMSGGPGAEMAMMASMPLMFATTLEPVLKMLIHPVALVVAGLLAVVATAAVLKSVFDNAATAARESTMAMGASTEAIRSFAEFSGRVTSGEIMDERRSGALSQFGVQSGKESVGALFIQTEEAKPLLEALKKELEGNSGKELVSITKNQLATAVATGALSRDEAASIAAQLGEEIGDRTFGIKVVGELNELIGLDGSNILKDPIGIRVRLLQETQSNLESQIASAGGQVSTGQQLANVGTVAGVGIAGAIAGSSVGLAAATAIAAKLATVGATVGSVAPGIGTAIGAVVGGAAGLAIGATIMADNFAKAGAAAGGITAQGVIALQQNQQILDSLDLEYEKRIASAKAAGDVLKAEKLILEQREGREEIIDVKKQTMESLVGQFQAAGGGFNPMNPMGEQLNKLIDSMYADNPVLQMLTTGARKSIEGSAGTAEQEFELKFLLASGEIDPAAMTNLMGLFGQDKDMIQKIINIQTNLSGADAGRAFSLASLFGKDVASQKQFLLDIEGKSDAQAGKLLTMFETVQQSGGILGMKAVLDAYMKDPAAGMELIDDLDKLRAAQEKGPITQQVITKVFGAEAGAAVLSDWEYFSGLDKENQITYMTLLQTAFETLELDRGAYEKWKAAQSSGADTSEQAFVTSTSRTGTDTQIRANTNAAANTVRDNTTSPSGGRQSSTFLDDVVKKIRDLRSQTTKLPKTLTEAMNAITNFGKKASAGFNGLSNGLRNAGAGAELINIALGATQEELAKIYKDGKLTKFGKNLERSLGRISLGNFVESQRASIDISKDQVTAFNKLRAAGVSVANAQEMIKDTDLVAGLTAAGASAKDTQTAVNEWMKAQKEGRKVLSDAERIIEAESFNVGVFNARIGEFQAGLNVVQLQEDDINKKYDDRLEALDKVQEANENIARQQQSQLTLADALSRGDIAAAARAMQETKEQSAQNALQQQRNAIEKAREKELKSIQANVNGELLNREEIQKRISDLQKQIADIELTKIRPQERIIAEQQQTAFQQVQDDFRVPASASGGSSGSGGGGGGGSSSGSGSGGETAAERAEREKREKEKREKDKKIKELQEQHKTLSKKIYEYKQDLVELEAKLKPLKNLVQTPAVRAQRTEIETKMRNISQTRAATERVLNSVISQLKTLGGVIPPMYRPSGSGGGGGGPGPQRLAAGGKVGYYPMGGLIPYKAMGGIIKLSAPEPAPAQMAGGGKVGYYPMGGLIPYKAMGGMFKTVNTDSVPAMLSPGEFVIRRSAVERFGEKNLEKINNGMADSSSSVYNYSVNVSVKSDANPDQIAQSVMRQIKQIDSQRIRGNRF